MRLDRRFKMNLETRQEAKPKSALAQANATPGAADSTA
jgi:hypothetical protein